MTASTAKSVTQTRRAAILNRFLKAQDRLVYQTSDLSLSSLASMTSSGNRGKSAIDLEPDFQRRKRWTQDKQSALIESFLLNVPVPPIYLAEDAYGQYSVVDGKQRLTAIHAFMTQGLRLKKLESFTELEGLSFSELPEDLQNALSIRPYVRVVTLLKQSEVSRISRTDLKVGKMSVEVCDGKTDREGEYGAEARPPFKGIQAGSCAFA